MGKQLIKAFRLFPICPRRGRAQNRNPAQSGRLAQLVRATRLHRVGLRFESSSAHQDKH